MPLPVRSSTTSPKVNGQSTKRDDIFLIFRLQHTLFAVSAVEVEEIALMAHLSKPAGAPSILAGFLNLAQRPIPVIRIDRLLEVSESVHGLYTQIIIFRDRNGIAVGWVVDQVIQIIPVSTDDIMPVPRNECFKDCATGTFLFTDSTVTILEPERVLLEKERQSIAAFQEFEQGRLRELTEAVS